MLMPLEGMVPESKQRGTFAAPSIPFHATHSKPHSILPLSPPPSPSLTIEVADECVGNHVDDAEDGEVVVSAGEQRRHACFACCDLGAGEQNHDANKDEGEGD